MLVVVLGAVGSFFAARAVAHSDKQKSQRALAATSADVTARLRLAIQHEEDLVGEHECLHRQQPAHLERQVQRVGARRSSGGAVPRDPRLGKVLIVPRSQLASYAARAIKDPAGPLAPGGSFQVIPSGKRPFYCFIDLAGRSPGLMVTPAVLDVCAATGNKIVPSHDPAQGGYEPVQFGTVRALGVQTPLYRGGLVPRTAAARRAAFIGWIGIALTPKVVMRAALEAHPETALTLRYARGASPVAFSGGKALRGAQSLTVDLHNGWTVRASAVVTGAAVFFNWHALSVLLGGDGF